MPSPSNVKRTNWKWRGYHDAGRLEAMEEVKKYIRERIQHHNDLARRIGRPHDSIQRELEDVLEFVERGPV